MQIEDASVVERVSLFVETGLYLVLFGRGEGKVVAESEGANCWRTFLR